MALWTECFICGVALPDLSSNYCAEHHERGDLRDKLLAKIWFVRGFHAAPAMPMRPGVIEKTFEDEWNVIKQQLKESSK